MSTLRDLYLTVCKKERVTPNSIVQKMLPADSAEYPEDELDLSQNYLGDRGFAAFCDILPELRIHKLSVRHNGLRNKAVVKLCDVLKEHETIEAIDLSDNFISTGAGVAIVELLRANKVIKAVILEHTKIDAKMRVTIENLLKGR
mmetsp:Transcript_5796/g.8522  ORF Transcript_5796/g.8522 Transcript_5796/m.8522 type:complete len:145 (+) Transcript_5796:55-489(+)